MKQNLLQLTQSILSNLSSDQVNSISDTDESLQIANIIRETYFNMLSKYDLPEHDQLFQLVASGTEAQPVLMNVPQSINKIRWIKYFDTNPVDGATQQTDQFGSFQHSLNVDIVPRVFWTTLSTTTNSFTLGQHTFTVDAGLAINVGDPVNVAGSGIQNMFGNVISYSGTTLVINITSIQYGTGTNASWVLTESNLPLTGPGYLNVQILALESFLKMTNQFNPTDSNVESFTVTITNVATGLNSNYIFMFKNNRQPQYCCILQNQIVIFDSYDLTQDSILQSSKTMCNGWVLPSFSMTDSFVPQLDDKQFPLLYNEAKSLAFLELKQMPHQKAEQEITRQLSSLQKYKSEASKPSDFDQLPNYGRRGHGWL